MTVLSMQIMLGWTTCHFCFRIQTLWQIIKSEACGQQPRDAATSAADAAGGQNQLGDKTEPLFQGFGVVSVTVTCIGNPRSGLQALMSAINVELGKVRSSKQKAEQSEKQKALEERDMTVFQEARPARSRHSDMAPFQDFCVKNRVPNG